MNKMENPGGKCNQGSDNLQRKNGNGGLRNFDWNLPMFNCLLQPLRGNNSLPKRRKIVRALDFWQEARNRISHPRSEAEVYNDDNFMNMVLSAEDLFPSLNKLAGSELSEFYK